jgi:hypothetical protein
MAADNVNPLVGVGVPVELAQRAWLQVALEQQMANTAQKKEHP